MAAVADIVPTLEDFRVEVRQTLAEELPVGFAGVGSLTDPSEAEQFVARWRETLLRRGLIGVTWPTEYAGRGMSRMHQVVLVEELARAGVPYGAPSDTYALKMLANTLLAFGTEAQKARFLPPIQAGTQKWCQGFSEPGAGSDLAGLRTRATLDGDQWVIDGQKIWTSHAQDAQWIFVLVRTDPGARGHRGVSFLLVPTDQPGVEIRPIRTMTGERSFCEVFFTAARTAAENVVGDVGNGWRVAMSLLDVERGEEAAVNPILFRAELDRLVALARERGLTEDPVVRRRLADCLARVEVMRFIGQRILARLQAGAQLGASASISKLQWSEYHQRVTALALDLLGLDGLVLTGRNPLRSYRSDDPGVPVDATASWNVVWMHALGGTIYAGTSEVQRNILAERVLGLPKERRG